ncbi:MAG: hypothetical protein IT557_00015 [Alphaproteobacteria bacterium]|nr:hypothetical protein [Alphaproteobacteria bacterium]
MQQLSIAFYFASDASADTWRANLSHARDTLQTHGYIIGHDPAPPNMAPTRIGLRGPLCPTSRPDDPVVGTTRGQMETVRQVRGNELAILFVSEVQPPLVLPGLSRRIEGRSFNTPATRYPIARPASGGGNWPPFLAVAANVSPAVMLHELLHCAGCTHEDALGDRQNIMADGWAPSDPPRTRLNDLELSKLTRAFFVQTI